MSLSTKTEDFGEKIGGARKDIWATRGLLSSDLPELTDYEKKEYVNKNNIWRKPDYDAMLAEGRPREVIYFIKLVRDALPAKISIMTYSDLTPDEQYAAYIDFIQEIKNLVSDIKSIDQIDSISDYLERTGKINKMGYRRFSVADKYNSFISNKLLNVMNLYSSNINYYKNQIIRKQFLYSEKDKIISKFLVMRYDAAATKSNVLSSYNRSGKVAIWGTPCELLDKDISRSRVGYPLPEDIAQPIIKDAVDGDYLCFDHGKLIGIQKELSKAYEACLEHYKETHPEETEKETKKSSRKAAYIPPQLRSLDRHGPVWRPNNRDIDGQRMLEEFGFRGGEFGNWLSESDRKQSLNFCYDAFMDLRYALKMQPSDVSFTGTLAIAFGSRGRGGARSAVAHYEPARQVINLTKMKGAGSLAHEWIHAMDHAVANYCAGTSMDLATKSVYSVKKEIPEEFFNIMKTIKGCRNYIAAAEEMDKNFGSDSQGYWSSDCELLARAGACWIHDRLTAVGIKNDYLCGHAEGDSIAPHGEERERINQAFNLWLDKAKDIGLFNTEYMLPTKELAEDIYLDNSSDVEESDRVYDPKVEYTQMSFFDLPEIAELEPEVEM